MFIVWIKYFSWPWLCCSVSFILFYSSLSPDTPSTFTFPLLPEVLQHTRRKSALKNTEGDREGAGLAPAQEAFWDASLP